MPAAAAIITTTNGSSSSSSVPSSSDSDTMITTSKHSSLSSSPRSYAESLQLHLARRASSIESDKVCFDDDKYVDECYEEGEEEEEMIDCHHHHHHQQQHDDDDHLLCRGNCGATVAVAANGGDKHKSASLLQSSSSPPSSPTYNGLINGLSLSASKATAKTTMSSRNNMMPVASSSSSGGSSRSGSSTDIDALVDDGLSSLGSSALSSSPSSPPPPSPICFVSEDIMTGSQRPSQQPLWIPEAHHLQQQQQFHSNETTAASSIFVDSASSTATTSVPPPAYQNGGVGSGSSSSIFFPHNFGASMITEQRKQQWLDGYLTDLILKAYTHRRQPKSLLDYKCTLQEVITRCLALYLGNGELQFKIYLIGSSLTSIGSARSDIDLCMVIYDTETGRVDERYNNRIYAEIMLQKISMVLEKCNLAFQSKVIPANVPILKFYDQNRIEVNLNLNKLVTVQNTMLLVHLCSLDSRVSPFLFMVKLWAQKNGINCAYFKSLSSYSLSLMAIFFLQNVCSPPILPQFCQLIDSVIKSTSLFQYHHEECWRDQASLHVTSSVPFGALSLLQRLPFPPPPPPPPTLLAAAAAAVVDGQTSSKPSPPPKIPNSAISKVTYLDPSHGVSSSSSSCPSHFTNNANKQQLPLSARDSKRGARGRKQSNQSYQHQNAVAAALAAQGIDPEESKHIPYYYYYYYYYYCHQLQMLTGGGGNLQQLPPQQQQGTNGSSEGESSASSIVSDHFSSGHSTSGASSLSSDCGEDVASNAGDHHTDLFSPPPSSTYTLKPCDTNTTTSTCCDNDEAASSTTNKVSITPVSSLPNHLITNGPLCGMDGDKLVNGFPEGGPSNGLDHHHHHLEDPAASPMNGFKSKNTQSLGALFADFITYYSDSSVFDSVISVRTGRLMKRTDPVFACSYATSMDTFICIEEPFNHSNTSHSVHNDFMFNFIVKSFRWTRDSIAKMKLTMNDFV